MKRIILVIMLIPQLAYSQFMSRYFQPDRNNDFLTSPVGKSFDSDTTIELNQASTISGFVVTGRTLLGNLNDSFVRIILKDSYNYEFLVYENYPMLSGCLSSDFSNTAMETIIMDDITPQSLKIELHNAVLQLDSYAYISAPASVRSQDYSPEIIQREQTQYLVSRLDSNLKQHNQTWRAGITSMSGNSYEEKKAMFGGNVPELYGFEHYTGGIFVFPTNNEEISKNMQNRTSNQYVSEWDWRNRHGKNWMTSVKNQGNHCGSCWAFAAVAVLEAYTYLYFNNDSLKYDLSEEELISCVDSGDCSGGFSRHAYRYIKTSGIVKEDCFEYAGYERNCNDKCPSPSEKIFIENYGFYRTIEDSIKKQLFKAPITIGVDTWHHEMAMAGYKTIVAGDTLYDGNSDDRRDTIVIDPINHESLIGKTAWLIKNSWGDNWGNQGFGYLIINPVFINSNCYLDGRIISQKYINNQDSLILCSDADGDGLYFWGIGDKPSNCPSWVPDIPDGDDSNINYGALDSLGYLQELPEGITINDFKPYTPVYSTSSFQYGIVNGGTFAIYGELELINNGKIRVCEGGTLLVEGGILDNADIVMVPGSQLIIRDQGVINMASGKELVVPKGAVVEIESGEINNYSDQ